MGQLLRFFDDLEGAIRPPQSEMSVVTRSFVKSGDTNVEGILAETDMQQLNQLLYCLYKYASQLVLKGNRVGVRNVGAKKMKDMQSDMRKEISAIIGKNDIKFRKICLALGLDTLMNELDTEKMVISIGKLLEQIQGTIREHIRNACLIALSFVREEDAYNAVMAEFQGIELEGEEVVEEEIR